MSDTEQAALVDLIAEAIVVAPLVCAREAFLAAQAEDLTGTVELLHDLYSQGALKNGNNRPMDGT